MGQGFRIPKFDIQKLKKEKNIFQQQEETVTTIQEELKSFIVNIAENLALLQRIRKDNW